MATEIEKDTFSIYEMSSLNQFLQDFNEFLVNHEGYDVEIHAATLALRDVNGVLVGSLTKWSKEEDVKFEPGFDVATP